MGKLYLKLDYNKDTKSLIDESYAIFCEILNKNELMFKNKKVFFKTEMDLHNNRELGYEHIVSMKNMNMRLYEKNIMIYLPIIEKILKHCCNDVKI